MKGTENKMANLKGCMMHQTDHWATPKKMYDEYIKQGYIDPCPLHCKTDNTNNIYKKQKIYINPPYSKIKEWVKFIKNNQKENEIVLLIPARTDTQYFHDLLKFNPYIQFIKGRLHFNDSKTPAPFPSILMTFGKYKVNIYRPLEIN